MLSLSDKRKMQKADALEKDTLESYAEFVFLSFSLLYSVTNEKPQGFFTAVLVPPFPGNKHVR